MSEPLNLGAITTEQVNPASRDIDVLPTLDMLRVFNDEDKKAALAVEAELPRIAAAVDAIAAALAGGGRLFYTGAGTSGRLGVLDASECPPTFNVPPSLVVGIMAGGDAALRTSSEGVEDRPEAGAKDLLDHGFTAADILCGIAASGRTPYVLGAVEAARQMGAKTIGVSCSLDSPLSRAVEFPIEPKPGPEVITGSTRLKSGTATKLVLNMLTTGTMIRLGYVYSNLMVNVQPSNEKLVDRAQRIVMTITGLDREAAAQALARAGMNVRLAIVMASLGVDRVEAEQRLAARGGNVRRAIAE